MKNKIKIWVIVALIALLAANEATATTVEIGTSPVTKLTEKNTNFSVNITFDPFGMEMAGAQFDLRFNKSALAVQNNSPGDLFKGTGSIEICCDHHIGDGVTNWYNPGIIDNINGSLINVWSAMVGPINTTAKGNMSNITIIATQNGTFPINLSKLLIADHEGNYVANNITNYTLYRLRDPNMSANMTIGYVCVSPNYNINCLGHKTDIVDLTILNQNWGRSGIAACPQYEGRCKNIVVDACDCVNTADKLKLQQNYGKLIILG